MKVIKELKPNLLGHPPRSLFFRRMTSQSGAKVRNTEVVLSDVSALLRVVSSCLFHPLQIRPLLFYSISSIDLIRSPTQRRGIFRKHSESSKFTAEVWPFSIPFTRILTATKLVFLIFTLYAYHRACYEACN